MTVVSDSGPLIALHEIGRIDLLHAIAGTVLIPPAVDVETYAAGRRLRPGLD